MIKQLGSLQQAKWQKRITTQLQVAEVRKALAMPKPTPTEPPKK